MISLCCEDEEDLVYDHIGKFDTISPQACIGWDSEIVADYQVRGAGYYFVIDRNGTIATVPDTLSQAEAAVVKLLQNRNRSQQP